MSKQGATIGESTKEYRACAGTFQDVLPKRANLAFHIIAKIQAGATPDPTIETVKKIAKVLSVGVDDLIQK